MPSKPDAKHAQQVAYYADVLGCQASLIYASETGYRLFDETNCQELTPEGIQRGVQELRSGPGHVKTSCAVRRTVGH